MGESGGSHLEIDIWVGPRAHTVFFGSDDVVLKKPPEIHLTAPLIPSMRVGVPVRLQSPISERLLSSADRIQDILLRWDPTLRRVRLARMVGDRDDLAPGDRVGAFFSGGVDSFHTLLKNRDTITDLLFVQGFDIAHENPALVARSSAMVRDVALRMQKRVVEIRTNIRQALMGEYVDWGLLGHGAALATIGHLLSHLFKRIYIASSRPFEAQVPWGSHPLLDPLWSSGTLEFVHDGCEAGRIEKLHLIAESEVALENLRVCFSNPSAGSNCGQCEKCVRTMLGLHAVGALDRCTTFDRSLDPRAIEDLGYLHPVELHFLIENLEALGSRSENYRLRRAILRTVRRSVWRKTLREHMALHHPRTLGFLRSLRELGRRGEP